MAIDFQDTARQLLIEALGGQGKDGGEATPQSQSPNGASKGGLSGVRGLAMGAGAAALAPVAAKGIGKLTNVLGVENPTELLKDPGQALGGLTSNLGDKVGSGIGDKVTQKVDEAGGASGILSDTVKGVLPFGGGGGDGGKKGGAQGVGKGRRMPVQQVVDIAAPLETVYNQWTQFEDWPDFMHRVTRATQEDDCTVSFEAKIWTRKREFTAEIETQRPNEVIKWKVSQGLNHTGLVTFHELGPRLTRVMIGFDVQPGGLVEKFARGARHVKRASRGDFHRFKAFIEMLGNETGAWRGVIEEGEVVEEHDPSYDEQREYGDASKLLGEGKEGEEDDADDGGEEEEEKPRGRRGRARQSGDGDGQRQSSGRARAASGGGQRSRSANGRQSSGRSKSGGAQRSQSSRGSSSSGGARSKGSRGGSSSGSRASSGGRSSSGSSARASSGRSRSSGSSSGRQSSGRSSGSSSGRQSSGRSRGSGSSSRGQSGAGRRTRSQSK